MSENENHPVLYTAADIQKIFACSKMTAYNIMHSKGFPAFYVNSRIYVEKGAFEKWLDRQRGEVVIL